MENDNFYTYIYLDPRKSGVYKYGDYTFEYEPFYVGKGKLKQWISHLYDAKIFRKNKILFLSHKYNKIRKILIEFGELIKNKHIVKVEENLTEQEAFELEIWLIWAIGRFNLKLGPLTNQTDGGEGVSGRIISEEHRQKLINSATGVVFDSIRKNNISKGNKGKKRTEEQIMILKTCNRNISDGARQKMGNSRRGKNPWNLGISLSEEHKKKIVRIGEKNGMYGRKGIKHFGYGKPLTDSCKKKISEILKGRPSPLKGKVLSDEVKQKMSDAKKLYYLKKRLEKEKSLIMGG